MNVPFANFEPNPEHATECRQNGHNSAPFLEEKGEIARDQLLETGIEATSKLNIPGNEPTFYFYWETENNNNLGGGYNQESKMTLSGKQGCQTFSGNVEEQGLFDEEDSVPVESSTRIGISPGIIPNDNIESKPSDMMSCKQSVNSNRPNGILSKRKDVILKTTVRSLKRFYESQCSIGSRIKSINQKSKIQDFFKKLDQLTAQRFSKYFDKEEIEDAAPVQEIAFEKTYKHESIANKSGKSFEDVKLLLAAIIMPDVMKLHMKTNWRKKMMVAFNDVIYKFSNKKLKSLLNNESYKIILREFFESEGFAQMLRFDFTLSQQPEIYQKAAKNILKSIQ